MAKKVTKKVIANKEGWFGQVKKYITLVAVLLIVGTVGTVVACSKDDTDVKEPVTVSLKDRVFKKKPAVRKVYVPLPDRKPSVSTSWITTITGGVAGSKANTDEVYDEVFEPQD